MLAGSEKHVVLCATTLRPTTLIDFLNEFYADVKLQVCFLCYFNRGEIVDIFKNVDNIDLFNYMKEGDRSYICNFCSCEKKAWKKIQAYMGFKPLTSAILVQCSATIRLTSQLEASH